MPTLAIKSGTTEIAGSVVKGSFSYFSGSTKDLGPTSSTGFYSGVDAPTGGYTVYQIGGLNGWTARVATDDASLNSILISYGGTGSTVAQNITWATNTNTVYVNTGPPPTYTIGQSALGGKIAYINGGGSSGSSGLVAATSDTSAGATWGCVGTGISGADGTAIGTGNQNTIDIMAGCAAGGIAARLCGNLVEGGYSDWYLPSKDELAQLYINRGTIGGFASGVYWSSTEASSFYAYAQNFINGLQNAPNKSNSSYVRAIRSF